MKKRPKLFLEINEITEDFILDYKNKNWQFLNFLLKKESILGKKLETKSAGKLEGHDLDPWVEWVTIHCGKPYKDHKIKFLGQAKSCKFPFVWEHWEKNKVKYVLWNVFNGFVKKSDFCQIFLPDPWTKINSKPLFLNFYTSPTRNLASSYTGSSFLKKIFYGFLSIFLFSPTIILRIPLLVKLLILYGVRSISLSDFYIIYEYLLTFLGLILIKFTKAKRIIITTNIVAHAQHHAWKIKGKKRTCLWSLFLMDNLLKMTFTHFQKTHDIFIINGISQTNVIENNEFDYLPLNGHKKLINSLGIKYNNLKPGMTHDAFLTFKNKNEKDVAKNILNSLHIKKERLFKVFDNGSKNLEFYLSYRSKVNKHTKIKGIRKDYRFDQLFYCCGQRTGSHKQKGFIIVPYFKGGYEGKKEFIKNQKLIKFFK